MNWIRYDGTPETLPETGVKVLLYPKAIWNGKPYGEKDKHIITHYTGYDRYYWYSEDREPIVGDYWAYLPYPEEVQI
jgi:hypothetical protein